MAFSADGGEYATRLEAAAQEPLRFTFATLPRPLGQAGLCCGNYLFDPERRQTFSATLSSRDRAKISRHGGAGEVPKRTESPSH